MSAIESVLQERRVFPPSAEVTAQATVSGMDAYKALVAEAERDYEGFWGRLARETLSWKKPFTKVLDESNAPFYKWYEDGELTASASRSSSKPTTAPSPTSRTTTCCNACRASRTL